MEKLSISFACACSASDSGTAARTSISRFMA